jgi:hypothetical protein
VLEGANLRVMEPAGSVPYHVLIFAIVTEESQVTSLIKSLGSCDFTYKGVTRVRDVHQLPTPAEPPPGPVVEVELLTLYIIALRPASRYRR